VKATGLVKAMGSATAKASEPRAVAPSTVRQVHPNRRHRRAR
jgi:hypothetical protein